MENYSWDSVAFVPKCNITFHGFGILGNYEKKDMEYKVRWCIDEEPSEELDFAVLDDQKDPER